MTEFNTVCADFKTKEIYSPSSPVNEAEDIASCCDALSQIAEKESVLLNLFLIISEMLNYFKDGFDKISVEKVKSKASNKGLYEAKKFVGESADEKLKGMLLPIINDLLDYFKSGFDKITDGTLKGKSSNEGLYIAKKYILSEVEGVLQSQAGLSQETFLKIRAIMETENKSIEEAVALLLKAKEAATPAVCTPHEVEEEATPPPSPKVSEISISPGVVYPGDPVEITITGENLDSVDILDRDNLFQKKLTITPSQDGRSLKLSGKIPENAEAKKYAFKVLDSQKEIGSFEITVAKRPAWISKVPWRLEGVLGGATEVTGKGGPNYEGAYFDGSVGAELELSKNWALYPSLRYEGRNNPLRSLAQLELRYKKLRFITGLGGVVGWGIEEKTTTTPSTSSTPAEIGDTEVTGAEIGGRERSSGEITGGGGSTSTREHHEYSGVLTRLGIGFKPWNWFDASLTYSPAIADESTYEKLTSFEIYPKFLINTGKGTRTILGLPVTYIPDNGAWAVGFMIGFSWGHAPKVEKAPTPVEIEVSSEEEENIDEASDAIEGETGGSDEEVAPSFDLGEEEE